MATGWKRHAAHWTRGGGRVAADGTSGRVHLRDWRHTWAFTIAFFFVAVVAGGLTLAFEADGAVPARVAGAVVAAAAAAGIVVALTVPFRRGNHARRTRRTSAREAPPRAEPGGGDQGAADAAAIRRAAGHHARSPQRPSASDSRLSKRRLELNASAENPGELSCPQCRRQRILTRARQGGDFYLATSGDFLLATSGDFPLATCADFLMATDIGDAAPSWLAQRIQRWTGAEQSRGIKASELRASGSSNGSHRSCLDSDRLPGPRHQSTFSSIERGRDHRRPIRGPWDARATRTPILPMPRR